MSMGKQLFRPGRNSRIERYTVAVADAAFYPADWVALSTTAPSSQGTTAGIFEGETLSDFDYIECTALDAGTAGSEGLALGCVMGKSITHVSDWSDVSGDVLADGNVCVIMSRGVHPKASQLNTGVKGDHLAASSTAYEPGNSTSIAGCDVGVVLINSTTYTRASAGDTHGSVAFVRCD